MPAQIIDSPMYGQQRSLTGSPLDAAVPGQYYDAADNARRRAAEVMERRISGNKAFANVKPKVLPSGDVEYLSEHYLSGGLSYDVEGLLRSVAMKYGLPAAQQLLERMPTMSKQELMSLQKLVALAAREYDSMDDRERMAYERAGMQYRNRQYVPK